MQNKGSWITSIIIYLLFIACAAVGATLVDSFEVEGVTIRSEESLHNGTLTHIIHGCTGPISAKKLSTVDYANKRIYCSDDGIIDHDPEKNTTESYAPRKSGLNRNYRQPVYGQPYQMECPLEGSHPTLYYWQKYETIDMATETKFSADVLFEVGGRVWYVDAITEEHSGMYVCSAVNHMGEMVFVDTINFYFSISACPYHASEISIQISPSSEVISYRRGETVVLVCTAVAVEEHEKPFWWREHENESMSICSRPQYGLDSSFESLACRWTTDLTITDFSEDKAGVYHCIDGTDGVNITLQVDDGDSERYPHTLVILTIILTGAVTLIIVITAALKFLHTNRLKLNCTEEPPYEGFTYDAFISAHDEAKEFVLESLLPPLESGPTPYRLCWHSRDFLPGIPIMEQIAQSMAKSRKIILVFSEHFSQSEFCRVELELAMNKYMSSSTRCVLPVTLAGEHVVPPLVKQTITYLPTVSADEGDVAGKIAQVMGQPIPIVMDRLNDSFVDE